MGVGNALNIPRIIGGARVAAPFNDNFNEIQAWANGNIGAGCLATNSVGADNIIGGSVTVDKLGVGAVTPSKLHDSAKITQLAPVAIGGSLSLTAGQWKTYGTFPEFTPSVDCRLFFSGKFKAGASIANTNTHWGIGTVTNAQSASTQFYNIPAAATADETTWVYKNITGCMDCVANTKYTLFFVGSNASATTRNVDLSGTLYTLVVPK
jgi:hypothetical protein